MRVKIIITSQKKIVTRYVEVDNREEVKALIPQIMEEEGIDKLKYPTQAYEVDEKGKRIMPTRITNIRGRK